MQENTKNASDGSVQEIAVNDRNPVGTERVGRPGAGISHDAVSATQDESVAHGVAVTPSVLTDKREASVLPEKIKTGMVPVARLRSYAKNADLYEEREDALFTENIRKNGVLTDLVVTEDGETLGGNRRLREAIRLGLQEVPVKVVVCRTADEKMLRVLDDNVQRVKTNAEIVREYVERLKVEARAAAQRKVEAARRGKGQAGEVKTFTPPASDKKAKARDAAAKPLNLSGVTAEKGRKVLEAVAEARARGATDEADKLLEQLNDGGFHSAFKRAEAIGLIPVTAKKPKKVQAVPKPETPVAAVPKTDMAANETKSEAVAAESTAITTHEAAMVEDDPDDSDAVIIANFIKAAEKLEDLMVELLSVDQKANLRRAKSDVSRWFAYNADVFREDN